MGAGELKAISLDAMGTLVGLEPPAPRLVRELAAIGIAVEPAAAAAAIRAEIAYYRANLARGTTAGLAALRRDCAGVLASALGLEADLTEPLLRSLRFFADPAAPAVLGELRALGLSIVVCSNWDAGLGEVLRDIGLLDLIDGWVASAVVGHAKPDARIFGAALSLVDVAPGAALHVGDDRVADYDGARAAGLDALLLGTDLTSLTELPALVSYRA